MTTDLLLYVLSITSDCVRRQASPGLCENCNKKTMGVTTSTCVFLAGPWSHDTCHSHYRYVLGATVGCAAAVPAVALPASAPRFEAKFVVVIQELEGPWGRDGVLRSS